MPDRKIVDLPTSQTLSDTDYMLVNQNGTPVWVVTEKMKQNSVNAVKHPDTLPNPYKLKFTGAVTDEYDGSVEKTISIPECGSGESFTNKIEMQDSDTEPTIKPNVLYVFPEMQTLNVILDTPENNKIANEFHFIFISGSIATTLSLSNKDGSQIYSDTYSIESNMKYEVSVLESIAYVKGVSINA